MSRQKTYKLVSLTRIFDHFLEGVEEYQRNYSLLLENGEGFGQSELESVLAKYRKVLLSQVVPRVESGPTAPGLPLQPTHFRVFPGKDPHSDDPMEQEKIVRHSMLAICGEVVSFDQDGNFIVEVKQTLITLAPADIRIKSMTYRQKKALNWFCGLVLTEAFQRARAAA